MTSQIVCGQGAADMWLFRFLSFPQAGTGIREIELSHMGKNNGNPDMLCAKYYFIMSSNKGEGRLIVFVVDPVSADALSVRYLMN